MYVGADVVTRKISANVFQGNVLLFLNDFSQDMRRSACANLWGVVVQDWRNVLTSRTANDAPIGANGAKTGDSERKVAYEKEPSL